MKTNQDIKETIIQVTTQLIEENNGEVRHITARMIAERSNVALGLINYHFQSKDNLLTICVQRIIETVVTSFNVTQVYTSDQERLTVWATHVFNFLFEHTAISRLSILGDMADYSMDCNSISTQKRLMHALLNDTAESDKPFLVFILTSAMQTAFLGKETVKDLLGYDFDKQADRASFIERLVSVFYMQKRKDESL